MGPSEKLLRAKNSQVGIRLKRIPLLRKLLPLGFDTVQRRLFSSGLLALETTLRQTRGMLPSSDCAPHLQDGRSAGEEFSSMLAPFLSEKLHSFGYQYVYGPLLMPRRDDRVRLLEIGIGTADPSLASSMGEGYIPGTSLRAWRELFPEGEIFGADIDERILLHEDRIQCFWVDQRSPESIAALIQKMGPVDIVIDDGLHTPEAAINSMQVLLPTVRAGGAYVLEDALGRFDSCWIEAARMLKPWFDTAYYCNAELNEMRNPREDAGLLLAIRRA